MILRSLIVQKLRQGRPVDAEYFAEATVGFVAIEGFVRWVSTHLPCEVVAVLNDIFGLFDSLVAKFDVLKIESIENMYLVRINGASV